jgi:hypothetical protein
MIFDVQSGVRDDPDRDLLSRLSQNSMGRGGGQ